MDYGYKIGANKQNQNNRTHLWMLVLVKKYLF